MSAAALAFGTTRRTFLGRFSRETFTVAPGTTEPPMLHNSPFKDADNNPATAPVHQYHLGPWFNDPTTAARAGCGDTVTPFNGEYHTGVQVLSARQFPALNGPLHKVTIRSSRPGGRTRSPPSGRVLPTPRGNRH